MDDPALKFAGQGLKYARRVGGSITSWLRTPARNRIVGGVHNSRHLDALAMDVAPDPGGFVLSREARYEIAAGLGVRLIIEGDHDHLQPLT